MIVKMSMVYIAVRQADRDELLDRLGRMNLLHFQPVQPDEAVPDEETLQEIADLDRALQILSPVKPAGRAVPQKPLDAAREVNEIQASIGYVFDLFPALAKLKDRKAGFLSGGEQQMLAIGMALVVRPKLLLLDEPLLGLSPLMQQVVMEAVVRLRENSGITVVLSEQFARPVLPVINRGYVVENGMLALHGTGEELMDNPEIKSAYFGI